MNAHDFSGPTILFVDDEAAAVKYFQRAIDTLAPVVTASTVEEGKRILDEHAGTLAVLVSDQRMPGGYGNELLHYARTSYPHIVRILTTAYSELERTAEAINEGQIDRYLQKPWDITALRMEMKQALNLAALRKEHAQLLREKMLVRQNQIVANRIGTLHLLCASLWEAEQGAPLENYLQAAVASGCTPAEPNWLLQDYADLVSAEAVHSGQLGLAIRAKLDEIHRQFSGWRGEQGLDLLVELLPGVARFAGDGSVTITDLAMLAEFLQVPSTKAVSQQHEAWLAFMVWLHQQGRSLAFIRQDAGIQCSLAQPVPRMSQQQLADWIAQFCAVPD